MDGKETKIYGYARTSTREQNEDRQLITLKEMGVPEKNIFLDKLSGKRSRTLKDIMSCDKMNSLI